MHPDEPVAWGVVLIRLRHGVVSLDNKRRLITAKAQYSPILAGVFEQIRQHLLYDAVNGELIELIAIARQLFHAVDGDIEAGAPGLRE